jgi:EAL domain-containing protein (putative c-di-GMP-specific phosphodiesterase class I)
MLFALGRSMGLRTVAEGVEEIEQFEVLCTQQCDVAQGFLFARPMPPAEALDFLRASTMAALGSSDAATPARRPTVET